MSRTIPQSQPQPPDSASTFKSPRKRGVQTNAPPDSGRDEAVISELNEKVEIMMDLLTKAKLERDSLMSIIENLKKDKAEREEFIIENSKRRLLEEQTFRSLLSRERDHFDDRIAKKNEIIKQREALLTDFTVFLTSIGVNYPFIHVNDLLQRAAAQLPAGKSSRNRGPGRDVEGLLDGVSVFQSDGKRSSYEPIQSGELGTKKKGERGGAPKYVPRDSSDDAGEVKEANEHSTTTGEDRNEAGSAPSLEPPQPQPRPQSQSPSQPTQQQPSSFDDIANQFIASIVEMDGSESSAGEGLGNTSDYASSPSPGRDRVGSSRGKIPMRSASSRGGQSRGGGGGSDSEVAEENDSSADEGAGDRQHTYQRPRKMKDKTKFRKRPPRVHSQQQSTADRSNSRSRSRFNMVTTGDLSEEEAAEPGSWLPKSEKIKILQEMMSTDDYALRNSSAPIKKRS